MASSSSTLAPLIASLSLALLLLFSQANDLQANIDLSIADIKKSITMTSMINSLKVYSVCKKALKDAIDNLQGIAAAQIEGKVRARKKAVTALKDVSDCENSFQGTKPEPVILALSGAKAIIVKVIVGI